MWYQNFRTANLSRLFHIQLPLHLSWEKQPSLPGMRSHPLYLKIFPWRVVLYLCLYLKQR